MGTLIRNGNYGLVNSIHRDQAKIRSGNGHVNGWSFNTIKIEHQSSNRPYEYLFHPSICNNFGRVPEISGTLPIRVLVMGKGNGFHSILLEILRLISTGLLSWSFNMINKKRIPITADSIAWFECLTLSKASLDWCCNCNDGFSKVHKVVQFRK